MDSKREECGKARGERRPDIWTKCDYLMTVSERLVRVVLDSRVGLDLSLHLTIF